MLSLLLVVVFLLRWERGAHETAPLYIFEAEIDLLETYGNASGRIDYVESGVVTNIIHSNPENAQLLPLTTRINISSFSLLVCTENIMVNITVKSRNTSLLGDPVLSVPSSFALPTCPYRVFILFSCNGSAFQEEELKTIVIELTFNAYTEDKEFDPIKFYLSKSCSQRAPQELIGAKEFPNDSLPFSPITGNPGCYNDTNLPVKSATAKSPVSGTSPGAVAAAVVVPTVPLIIIIIVLIVFLWWFRRRSSKKHEFDIDRMAEAYETSNHPLFDRVKELKQAGPHEKEFSLENITFARELGEGAFGCVYEAVAANIIAGEDSTTVAVKQLKLSTSGDDDVTIVDFFKEVTFMSKLDHPRIVKLLGVCSVTEPYCMIFEYMDLGNLNSYLRSAIGLGPNSDEVLNKETCFLQLSDLLSIVEQIAEGMKYLSSKNLVHRDLATRNCLVATGLEVKISDFGLSRDISSTDYYRLNRHAVLPIRWMAPESIIYGKFTTATDVWSFGIVVWEVFTYGQQPYVGMTNEEVIKFVTKQGTLEPPSDCPQKVTKVMTQCWSWSPGSRPSFSKLLTTIQQLPSILKHVTYDSPDYPAISLN